MSTRCADKGLGCLLIDDLPTGENALSGLFTCKDMPYARLRSFSRSEGEKLHDALQCAHQAVRTGKEHASIVARGLGCEAALALAEQLPVDRLALISPWERADRKKMIQQCGGSREKRLGALMRQIMRMSAYARRNLSLCVSDILIVERGNDRAWRALKNGGICANSRVTRIEYMGDCDKNLCINREMPLKAAISCFLQSGELPKSLAENPEMCIIYG